MAKSSDRLLLYHWAPSRSLTARWMLEEVGRPYDIALVDISKGEQHEPRHLALNPMGKLPVLAHGDVVISETAAICCYLTDVFPDADLAPAIDHPLRGPYLKWLFYMPSCFEPAITHKAMGWPDAPRGTLGWGSYDAVVATLERALASSRYILGDRFSAADVIVGAGIRWGLEFKLLPETETFRRYSADLLARPALQRQRSADAALIASQSAPKSTPQSAP